MAATESDLAAKLLEELGLTAINAATGDVVWQVPLGITEQLPAGKQNTGRPALAGPMAAMLEKQAGAAAQQSLAKLTAILG